MSKQRSVVLIAAAAILLFLNGLVIGQVSIDPIGITVAVENEDVVEIEMTLTNSSDAPVIFSVGFDEPPEEERRGGPRRDVDLEGLMFAVFQDNMAYNWLDEQMVGPVVENDQLDSYRNANDWNDVEFEDYNVIVLAAGQRQGFSQQYQDNYERFCEYIDGGGAAYFETHDPNSPIHSPGDIVNNVNHRTESGRLVVSPDPEDDNYSLFAELCHEAQENYWEEGEQIEGNAWLHSAYSEDQFEDGVEDGTLEWYQVLANASNNQPGAIAYGYGRGTVLVLGHPTGHTWTNWDDEGQWGSIAAEILFYLTEMSGPKWILADPEEGVIEAEDSGVFNIAIAPIEMEDGVYEMRIQIELEEPEDERDDLEQTMIEISAVMSLSSPVAAIAGTITRAANGEVVEGARADNDVYILSRFSDEEGAYSFDNMPPGDYTISFSATDYLPTAEDVVVEEDDVELNIALLHSECNPDRESITEELPIDDEVHVQFNISNNGNGDLTYMVDRRLLGDANAEPWEFRRSYPVSEIVEDTRIEGVIFDGVHFYVAGANLWEREDGPNMIYVIDSEGEFVREFEQPGDSHYGMRDLAWDGELIWGSGADSVYGFTTDGEQVRSFMGPYDTNSSLAWDSDREVLWVAGRVSNEIVAYTRLGEEADLRIPRFGLRLYGLAYWKDAPDGYPLYILTYFDNINTIVYKVNPDIPDTAMVAILEPEAGGSPGGAFITNQFDVYSWVFMNISNEAGEDRIDIWQVDARKDWMQVDPAEGVIAAGESQEFDLLLDSHDLPAVTFEGELVFVHDGEGGETHIAITLNVTDEEENEPPTEFNLLSPLDGEEVLHDAQTLFSWQESTDPDPEDAVSYMLWFGIEDNSLLSYDVADTTILVKTDSLFNLAEEDMQVTWWVVALSGEHSVECTDRFTFLNNASSAENPDNNLPTAFALYDARPNPFNSVTTLKYDISEPSNVNLSVFDVSGRLVETLCSADMSPGSYSISWDAGSLSTGVYIVRMETDRTVHTRKVTLVR